jgi:hypothetical protein
MPRSISIHVGVNDPGGECGGDSVLAHSEDTAGRMAGLAVRAGYGSVLMLRGAEATRRAVRDALSGAAETLGAGDVLFVSFSGHGEPVANHGEGERKRLDETWCLHDGGLPDDDLVEHWRAFAPGVRIVVVSESCHGGRSVRGDEPSGAPPARDRRRSAAETAGFTMRPPRDADGIRASVLVLAACNEQRPTRAGVFARHLFAVWADGAYRGTFRDLYLELRRRMGADSLEPHILMLGAPDPDFLLEPAFHRDDDAAAPRGAWS